jgi:hypothetical protein
MGYVFMVLFCAYMPERLQSGHCVDPTIRLSQESYPPRAVQARFFEDALGQSAQSEAISRHVCGPYYNNFNAIASEVDGRIKELDPTLTPEHIMPLAYQSNEVREKIASGGELVYGLKRVAKHRQELLDKVATDNITPVLRTQQISSGSLDEPPYYRQQEDWKDYRAARGCANACFRMIFGAITGWTPLESAVAESLEARYGTPIVDDSVYNGIYGTEAFKEICDRKVRSIEIIGADFETIQNLTIKLKQRQPEVKVYCTLSLASRNTDKSAWHSCVLLGAADDQVAYHDPSSFLGGANITECYDTFAARWAAAYNRALLTIVL